MLVLAAVALLVVIYVAYQIGRFLLRVFLGLAALGLLSWGLWKIFHS